MILFSIKPFPRLWAGFLLAALSLFTVQAVATAAGIGESYGGGIVFSLDASGRHGLIAAKADLQGRSSTSMYAGRLTLPDAQTGCSALVSNGYSDWFLPDKAQLKQLYLKKDAVGGFTGTGYWSSSEGKASRLWIQLFSNGYQYAGSKTSINRVRAVRAF